jgi:hypothetical protein
MEPPKKKRGRPPKKRPEQTPEYWEKQLHNHHLGMDRADPAWQVLVCNFVNDKGERVSLERVGRRESITQQTDVAASPYVEAGADESIVLPPPWLRYLEYTDIIAELHSPNDQGATLKKRFLENARSRCGEERPIDFSCVGTPAEFKALCAQHHVEVQVEFPIINIIGYPLPSDKP